MVPSLMSDLATHPQPATTPCVVISTRSVAMKTLFVSSHWLYSCCNIIYLLVHSLHPFSSIASRRAFLAFSCTDPPQTLSGHHPRHQLQHDSSHCGTSSCVMFIFPNSAITQRHDDEAGACGRHSEGGIVCNIIGISVFIITGVCEWRCHCRWCIFALCKATL